MFEEHWKRTLKFHLPECPTAGAVAAVVFAGAAAAAAVAGVGDGDMRRPRVRTPIRAAWVCVPLSVGGMLLLLLLSATHQLLSATVYWAPGQPI